MIEKEITIDSYGNRLSGTVCLPEGNGRFPLVLMLHGSGPLDRDENMKGQRLNVFNTIAHYLIRHAPGCTHNIQSSYLPNVTYRWRERSSV